MAHRLAPRTAAPALLVASSLAAAASTWGLLLLSATLLHAAPPVAEHAPPQALAHQPVPTLVAAAATAALAVGGYRLAVTIRSRRRAYRALRGVCAHSAAQELVVIQAREPHAVAVPGRPRRPGKPRQDRILVTSGMLAALAGDERAVLLAHERAHLRERHCWQHGVVAAAAAITPLLRPARDSVVFLLERCADEAAAAAVGSRPLARSLARAALATSAAARESSQAFERLAVTSRVAALSVAPPPARRLVAAVVVAGGLLTAVAAAHASVGFMALAERLLPGI